MYKSILLAVDSSHYSEVCTRYALEYTKVLNAHINILTVLDRKEYATVFPYYYPSADFPPVFDESVFERNELYDKQRKRAEHLLSRIRSECEHLEVSFSCAMQEGIVAEIILEEVQSSDLLFVGQRGLGAEFSTGLLGSNLESVVRRSRLPVIVTPHVYRTLQKILVCFDGSEYSLQALRTAAHLAASITDRNVSLRLLVVQNSEETARQLAQKALKYLDAYQMHDIFVYKSGDPAEIIVDASREEDVDLIAMGAYGHSHMREMVLGSTTERVLRKMNRALLLHH
ncbi:MAG: universal stress protein [Candidatus Omnitrophota bacterium]|jgi:nucleotide-binding universal stress UspA family protein|nr:MAG: universal stress protein [Candidatus Omnitrophota bacterium]